MFNIIIEVLTVSFALCHAKRCTVPLDDVRTTAFLRTA